MKLSFNLIDMDKFQKHLTALMHVPSLKEDSRSKRYDKQHNDKSLKRIEQQIKTEKKREEKVRN